MKKLIAALTTAGLLIGGTAGMAQAAETTNGNGKPTHTVGKGRRAVVKVAATTIGIEPRALAEAVRDGQSVADVARSHDVEPQAVIDAIVAARTTRIDQAVAGGTVSSDRAAKRKARLPQRVTKLVNGELKGDRGARSDRATARRHARRAGIGVAATTIGIEPRALAEAVRDGQSVADVARSHDVEPQAVIDAVVAAATTRIDQAVADGKLGARRAERMKDRLPDRVARLVNATPRDRAEAGA